MFDTQVGTGGNELQQRKQEYFHTGTGRTAHLLRASGSLCVTLGSLGRGHICSQMCQHPKGQAVSAGPRGSAEPR